MKRSSKRARIPTSEDNNEEVNAKKSNLSSQNAQDEIEWAAEETAENPKSETRIRIVKSNAPVAPTGYRYPRLIPPWTNRVRANRYLNIDSEEYYIARADAEVADPTAYSVADITPEVPATEEVANVPTETSVIVKPDLDEEEQEIVVDDVNEEKKQDIKPRQSGRVRKAVRSDPAEGYENDPRASDSHVISHTEPIYAYEVVGDGLPDTVVVDDNGQPTEHIEGEDVFDIYQQPYTEEVNSLFVLGSELAKHPWQSNDEVNHFFLANPTLNAPIDIRELATMAKTATPDLNYQLIVGLAGLVNTMKRDMSVLKVEMNSLRDMVSSRQDLGNTKRRFSTMNNVQHQWRIQSQPPLREVDLVQTARTVDISRGTKKPLSNKEGITRFVKTVLELLIPEEQARYYTVRERTHRRNGLKDIGEHAKEQIVGCVLDLLGLYDIESLDSQGRGDRLHFTNLINQAMRMSL
uniref:Phosphoprotein n=1 Tax=Panagrolaimus sp. ES5 TaxID=591445 RepID=A0AC34F9W1_9BILA